MIFTDNMTNQDPSLRLVLAFVGLVFIYCGWPQIRLSARTQICYTWAISSWSPSFAYTHSSTITLGHFCMHYNVQKCCYTSQLQFHIPNLLFPLFLCGYSCVVIPVWLFLCGYSCVVIPVWLFLCGYSCVVIPVWLFLCGYSCVVIPVWLFLCGYSLCGYSCVVIPCVAILCGYSLCGYSLCGYSLCGYSCVVIPVCVVIPCVVIPVWLFPVWLFPV